MSIKLAFEPFYNATGKMNNRKLRDVIGSDHYTIKKANVEGLTINQADIWCEKIGIAPYEIWPEWIDIILKIESNQMELFV